MRRLFKWLFSTKSKSKKYKYELILIGYLVLISLIVIVISNTINLGSLVNRILRIFMFIQWIFIFPCLIRLFDISDYNERNRVINGKKKFKFEPFLCNINEIENWLMNAEMPDALYVKSVDDGKITIISVSFETVGRNGPFINKEIWFNDKKIENIQDVRKEIYDTCMINDDCVYIMAITEYNDPKYFTEILK